MSQIDGNTLLLPFNGIPTVLIPVYRKAPKSRTGILYVDIGVVVSLERTEWICRFRCFQNYLPQLPARKSRNFSIVTNSINLPKIFVGNKFSL